MESLPPETIAGADQKVHVAYTYERDFIYKEADVKATLSMSKISSEIVSSTLSFDDFPVTGDNTWNRYGSNEVATNANGAATMLLYDGEHAYELADYYFTVKGFVDPSIYDGDYVGVIFHYTSAGFYKLYWDGGDNGVTLRLVYQSGSTQKVLWSSPTAHWIHGRHYQYRIYISKWTDTGYAVTVQVDDIDSVKNIANFIVNIPITSEGTFGVYSESQQGTYFYDMEMTGRYTTTVEKDVDVTLTTSLSWDGQTMTNPISSYFQESIDNTMLSIDYRDYTLDKVTYTIMSKNVTESIYFVGTKDVTTTNGDDKITMATYDYGISHTHEFDLTIAATGVSSASHDFTFDKDYTIKEIQVIASESRFQDMFTIMNGPDLIEKVENVILSEYDWTTSYEVGAGDIIRFDYRPNVMKMEFFTGPSIDTHEKVYRLNGNELGWFAPEV
jgi:hypothetical protein